MTLIKIHNGEFESFIFPGGEVHVKITNLPFGAVNITAPLRNSDDIMLLLLLGDALKREGKKIGRLEIPYFPYARQDRVCNYGEALSVKVMADLINSLEAESVMVWDPHSDVTTALVKNLTVLPQWNIIPVKLLEDKIVICPNAGAEKKIIKLKHPYILCTKERDTSTGDIKRTIVHHHGSLEGKDCIIVDDICDGGRTFIEIAKVLKTKNAGKIELYVTHGIFSKGLDVFTGFIDAVHYYDQERGIQTYVVA